MLIILLVCEVLAKQKFAEPHAAEAPTMLASTTRSRSWASAMHDPKSNESMDDRWSSFYRSLYASKCHIFKYSCWPYFNTFRSSFLDPDFTDHVCNLKKLKMVILKICFSGPKNGGFSNGFPTCSTAAKPSFCRGVVTWVPLEVPLRWLLHCHALPRAPPGPSGAPAGSNGWFGAMIHGY